MNFDQAFNLLIIAEGYHVVDQGGYTLYGISENAHPKEIALMKTVSKTRQKQIAKQIYREDYWDAIKCDKIKPKLRYAVFSTCVNMGQRRALKYLKDSSTVEQYLMYVTKEYARLAKEPKQKNRGSFYGWINRVIHIWENHDNKKIKNADSVHIVISGDTFGKIAKKYGKSVKYLKKCNPDHRE